MAQRPNTTQSDAADTARARRQKNALEELEESHAKTMAFYSTITDLRQAEDILSREVNTLMNAQKDLEAARLAGNEYHIQYCFERYKDCDLEIVALERVKSQIEREAPVGNSSNDLWTWLWNTHGD